MEVYVVPPPDANANYVIDTAIKPLYVCCNNSCYTRYSESNYCDYRKFTQYQGGNVQIIVVTKTLNEADKLNGIEWAAKLTVYGGKAYRECDDCSKEWKTWQDMPTWAGKPIGPGAMVFEVDATKKNGKWEYSNKRPTLEKGITCADIPQ